ncbi:MAG TPA: pilus assembly protein TadG-related protein [Tepidisphaeraceae bacterium]|jgi:Flp pilus assembly protein TadG|nr:pilus assembly protein TadG-related protein [Tepidisphaeraceae bacterium]
MKKNTPLPVPAQARRSRGIALVYVAIVMVVLVGIIGLASDTAYVYLVAHQLQNAADAAALAGANMVSFDTTQANADAVTAAGLNQAGGASVQLDSAVDVLVGSYDRSTSTFTVNGSPANAVQVTARRTAGSPAGALPLIFGPMVNVRTSNVSRTATAMTRPLSAGLLVLNKTASPAIQMKGTGSDPAKIDVSNGGVMVDSSASLAIDWTGHPIIVATSLGVDGNETAISTGGVYPTGDLTLQAPYVPDPLASLPVPSNTGLTPRNPTDGLPGYYSKGLSGSNLAPGTYWVDGGIDLSGSNKDLTGSGVFIYLNTGGISMKGNSTMTLTPMSSGTYAGITIFQARTNSSQDQLGGTSGASTTGRLYLPAANVDLQGTPGSAASQLICDTLTVEGDAQLNINYDHSYDIQQHESFLVQ